MHEQPSIAVFAYHPVWYHSGFYRAMQDAGLNARVLFCDRMGVEPVYDEEYQVEIRWNVPLLEGYRHEFLRNLSWNRSGGRFFWRRINPGILSALRRYDVLLLHGFGTLSCLFALLAAKLWRLKIIWRGEATLADYDGQAPRVADLKRRFVRWALNRCDAVMYSCTGNRDYLVAHGVAADTLFPLPCAVDNAYFQRQALGLIPQRNVIRAELGIPADAFVIIMVSRLTPRKRPMDLLQAVNQLDPQLREQVHILICGDGPEKAALEAYGGAKSLQIHFTGFVNHSEVSRYYSIADIYAMVSSNDPSPKAMNEAMNFSLPVICTRAVGTAVDLVKEGVNGFLIDVGDIPALSQHLRTLIDAVNNREMFGRMSLEIVSQWTFDAEIEGLERSLAFVGYPVHAANEFPK